MILPHSSFQSYAYLKQISICSITESRALDKREYFEELRDNFSYFSSKPYVMTPHLNCLIETVQMRGHNIRFDGELTKIIPNYQQILPLI